MVRCQRELIENHKSKHLRRKNLENNKINKSKNDILTFQSRRGILYIVSIEETRCDWI